MKRQDGKGGRTPDIGDDHGETGDFGVAQPLDILCDKAEFGMLSGVDVPYFRLGGGEFPAPPLTAY